VPHGVDQPAASSAAEERSRNEHHHRPALSRALPGFAFTPFDEGLRATLSAFGALGHA